MNTIVGLIRETIIDKITEYNDFMNNFRGKSIKSLLGKAEINLFNERSVAHYFDKEIELSLKGGEPNSYFLSEAFIKYTPNSSSKLKAIVETKYFVYEKAVYELTKDHKLFIPDALIAIPESLKHKDTPLYCIEYKVSTRFDFLKLALDFMKYKYYSSAFNHNSTFVYILFRKSKDGKTLKLKGTMKLERYLTKNKNLNDYGLFYYENTATERNNTISADVVKLIGKILNEIEKYETVEYVDGIIAERYDNAINRGVRKLVKLLQLDFPNSEYIVSDMRKLEEFLRIVINEYA